MLTGSEEFIERARVMSLHGMTRDAWKRYQATGNWFYEVHSPGFKYNMTDVQSSLGIWQLRKFHQAQQRRHEIAAAYNEAFAQIPELQVPAVRDDVQHAWHLYVLRTNNVRGTISRDDLICELDNRRIGTSVHFVPIHMHPYYREKYDYSPNDLPVARDNFERMVSLPLYPGLTDEDVADVIAAVADSVATLRRRRAA
jgi:dTDP-4-amino-4,6-dideoxygalactose transaminase